MDNNISDTYFICRHVGSTGLVIFERDDILLRHRPHFEDQTLGDIDACFVAMLQELREMDVRFGFISQHPAPPLDVRGLFDRATLTRLLDNLLKVSGAIPDFWIDAVCSSNRTRRELLHGESDLDLILKLTGWSEVYRKTRTVMVRKAEAPSVRSDTPEHTEILYPGLRADISSGDSRRATVVWLKTMIKRALILE